MRLPLGFVARLASAVLFSVAVARAEPPAKLPPSAPAPAAAGPAEATVPRAESLLEQGVELRRLGKDEEALPALEEAVALQPESTRARVHLAAAHQALGHWLEADVLLREVLQESDDAYVQRHQATLQRAAEFVGRHVGSLIVSGTPAGAVVQVDGRQLGRLPLSATVRLPVGAYQLEVSGDGYYPVRRPISIVGGAVLREAVVLAALPASPGAARGTSSEPEPRAGGSPQWLSWTLTGLAAGAALTTVAALVAREQHAERWNSPACLQSGQRRGEVCPDELDAGKAAERVAYVSAIGAVLFSAGAVISWTLGGESPAAGRELASCGLGLASAVCSGSF